MKKLLSLPVALVALALFTGPAVAQQQSWSVAIEQNPMLTNCGATTNIPVAGAGTPGSCATAIPAAQNLLTTLLATPNCMVPHCPAGYTMTPGVPSCTPDPYTLPNGQQRTRYQVNLKWNCVPPRVSCATPPPATNYNTGSTSANNVPLNQCYKNTAGECVYNFAVPGTAGGWNTGCPPAIAGSNCCGWTPSPATSCQDDLTSGKLTITGPNVSNVTATSANLGGSVNVASPPPGCTYQAKLVWGPAPTPPFPNTAATGSIPPSLLTLSGTASPLNPSSGYGARIEVTKACAGQATTCNGQTKFFETPKGEGKCDLEIKKSLAHMAQHPPFQTGQQVAFEIYVTNQGTGTCSAPISVTDNFSQGLTYVSGGTSGWVCPPGSIAGSGSVTCTYNQPIAPSQTSMFLVSYTVTGPPPNVVGNCVIVKHPNDSNQANNRACIEVPVEKPKAVCTITSTKKTGPVASPPFPFTVTGPPTSSFTLTNGQSHTVTVPCASPSNPSVAASYTVTETPVPGWAPTNIACGLTGGTMSVPTYTGNSAQFQVGLTGSNVQCTFTNTPTPPACTITITKKTKPAGGTGFSFSSAWSGLQGITLNDGQSISKPVPCGPIFNVFETPKPGWAPTNITCTFTGGTGNFKILGATTGATNGFEPGDSEVNFDSLTPGANLQCTFANAQPCDDVTMNLSTGQNPNWTVTPGSVGVITNLGPLSGVWVPPGPASWIQPASSTTPQLLPGGIFYQYSVPFTLNNPALYSSIQVTGGYAADNGVPAGVSMNNGPSVAPCAGPNCFSSMHPFSITQTTAIPSNNHLDVRVYNNPTGGTPPGPTHTGLIVNATLRAICKK